LIDLFFFLLIHSECCLQGFHEAVFQSPETLRNYHKNAGDPVADVPDWEDDVRVISFAVPLSGVPEVVKKAIGMTATELS
jgi:hypothetical protein